MDPQTLLDAVEAAISGSLTTNQQSVSIAGRSLSKIPLPELFRIRDQLRREVRSQMLTASGISPFNNLEVLL